MRRALTGLALLAAAALVLAVAGGAATLPAGTSISADITSPADGSVFPQGSAVTINGTASVGRGVNAANTTIVYIVDVSGSTDTVTATPTSCPNSTVYKNKAGTTLDCEVLAVRALNRQAVTNGNVAAVGLIAFAGCAGACVTNSNGTQRGSAADAQAVDLAPGGTTATTLAAPDAGHPVAAGPFFRFTPNNNLEWLLQGAYTTSDIALVPTGWPVPTSGTDGFTQFQPGGTRVGQGTNYWAALMALDGLAHSITTPNTLVVFVSDGDSNTTGPAGEVVADAINVIRTDPNIHTTIKAFTFGMGAGADCVAPAPNAGSMQEIATAFGGACAELPDPSQAAGAAPALIQSRLASVSYTADAAAATPTTTINATGPVSSPFSHTFTGLANGTHELCATAHGSDGGGSGDSDPNCIHVTLQAPPTIHLTGGDDPATHVAGEVPEGSSFPVGATVDTTGTTTATWTSDSPAHCVFADPHALSTSVTCDNGDATYALTLTVVDDATPAQSATATEHLKVDNVVPTIAYAVTPAAVGLSDGHVHAHVDITDPGAETWTCTINWADGSTDTLTSTTRACDADHTYTAAGVFPTHVEVTDDGGFAEAVQGVTVQGAPTLTGLPSNGPGGQPAATVDEASPYGIHIAADEPLTSIAWSASGGTGTCDFSAQALDTSLTCNDDGTYHVHLDATDAFGQTTHGDFDLLVVNVDPTPTLTVSPALVPLNAPVHAAVTIDDPGHDTWTCTIDWGDGSAPAVVGPVGSRTCAADHAYSSGGTFPVSVTVEDDDHGHGAAAAAAHVQGRPEIGGLPTDAAGGGPADHVLEGTAYALHAAVSPDVTLGWTASLGAPGHCTLTNSAGPSTSLTCDDNGIATVDVTATDGFGQTSHATFHIAVLNADPTISVSSPNSGSSSRTVSFTALVGDPGANDSLTCTINWGDGSPTETVAAAANPGTCNATHTYALSVAAATVTASVADDDGGQSAPVSRTLTFNRAPVCVDVRSSLATLWPPNHQLVLVTLSGATDADGDALTYTVTGVRQDEPLLGTGSGDTSPDAKLATGGSVWLRAERAGTGDGRVYTVSFRVDDPNGGSCSSSLQVTVVHDQAHGAIKTPGVNVNSLG